MAVVPEPPKDPAALLAWAGQLVIYLNKELRQANDAIDTVDYTQLSTRRPGAGGILRLTNHPDGKASIIVGNGKTWDRYVASGAP